MANSSGPPAFGKRISKLRKTHSISQQDLAQRAQLSQATISRLEASDSPPSDVQTISKLARALKTGVAELLDGFPAPSALVEGEVEQFYAFCPNPFCSSNEVGRGKDKKVFVRWRSGEMYEGSTFDEVNYCRQCGTSIIKQCPSCKKTFRRQNTQYCVTCGTAVCERPTKEDWAKIAEDYPDIPSDDDIPF